MQIEVGSQWNTGFRTVPRTVTVTEVVGDEVRFRFNDNGTISCCTDTAFRRTYKPVGGV